MLPRTATVSSCPHESAHTPLFSCSGLLTYYYALRLWAAAHTSAHTYTHTVFTCTWVLESSVAARITHPKGPKGPTYIQNKACGEKWQPWQARQEITKAQEPLASFLVHTYLLFCDQKSVWTPCSHDHKCDHTKFCVITWILNPCLASGLGFWGLKGQELA